MSDAMVVWVTSCRESAQEPWATDVVTVVAAVEDGRAALPDGWIMLFVILTVRLTFASVPEWENE